MWASSDSLIVGASAERDFLIRMEGGENNTGTGTQWGEYVTVWDSDFVAGEWASLAGASASGAGSFYGKVVLL